MFCASNMVSVNVLYRDLEARGLFFSCEKAGSLLSQWEAGEDTQKYLEKFPLYFFTLMNL